MTSFDEVNFEFLKLRFLENLEVEECLLCCSFLNIVQEAILIKNLKSKFSKRYKVVNFTILIIAAHLTFQKLEQRNYLVSYFFVRWLTHYFGIQRPSNWQFSTHTCTMIHRILSMSHLQFPWRDFIENASFWVRFGAGTAKSMLKAWLKHYHNIRSGFVITRLFACTILCSEFWAEVNEDFEK